MNTFFKSAACVIFCLILPSGSGKACQSAFHNLFRLVVTPKTTIKQDLPIESNFFSNGEKARITCTDGVTLDSEWLPGKMEETVIIFHGSGSNYRSMYSFARWFNSKGYNVLALTIRGYPGSDGPQGLLSESSALDAEAAYRFVSDVKNIQDDKILVFGFSLGGLYASYVAALFNLPLILHNTFTDIEGMVEAHAPGFVVGPLSRLTKHVALAKNSDWNHSFPVNSLSNIDNVSRLNRPLLIIYTRDDAVCSGYKIVERISAAHGTYVKSSGICNRSNEFTRILELPHGGHKARFVKFSFAKKQVSDFLRDCFID